MILGLVWFDNTIDLEDTIHIAISTIYNFLDTHEHKKNTDWFVGFIKHD